MIDRYTRPEMGHIFSLENKYAVWQEIEVLACEAQAELGKSGITAAEAAWIREHAAFDRAEVDAIEAVTNHDVIAFLTNMGEHIDAEVPEGEPKPSRWVHYGMTSSDLGDTALCYQLTQACDILIDDAEELADISGGALVKHLNGKLDITCKTHLNNDVPHCTWSLNLSAATEEELREDLGPQGS